ncbi:MAG: DUF5719 family protein [Actinomycetota bacterium]|nr:DUF5719 family protein [Actinomycetota bacterium]
MKKIFWVVVGFLLLLAPQAALAADQTYTFKGRGTAHGVGLDMAGVKGLADANRGYEDILKTYYTGASIAGGREGEEIRVGILNAGELQFTADSGYSVYPDNQGPGAHVARDAITHVTYENGQYVTRIDGVGTWRASGFTRLNADGAGRLKVLNNARRYRGRFEARRSSTGLLWAIEVTNLEDYVKGIAEEPNTWPLEAQRTLAVAARTYGLNKKLYSTRWDSENFDIDATLGSQYYLGYDAERPNLVQAVADTRGKVVIYDNKVIVAAYHGNSGGHTEDIENVWGGTAIPYLRGVPSPWGYVYRWEKILTKADMEAKINRGFQSLGQSTGTLYSIDLSDKTAGGRVHKIKITGSYGTRTLLAYGVLGGWLGLPSALVDKMSVTGTDDWDESILLVNPNDQTVNVKLTFIFPDRRAKVIRRRIGPVSRRTLRVDNLVRGGPVSVKVESTPPIVAERTVYFAHGSDGGGDNSIGARSPSRRWYFAEGKTGRDYDTYLLIMNPRSAPTVVTATFMPGSGRRVKKKIRVPGLARREIKVDDLPGLSSAAVPAVVTSPKPVVVERSTYVNHNGVIGGAATIGSRTLAKTWYFAEGFTGSGFNTRLLIFNPAAAATTVMVALNKTNGAAVTRSFTIKARSRKEINLNRLLAGDEFGITLTAATGVVAERTTYFNSGGRSGVHATIGSPKPAGTWYFAEGSTGSGVDEFLTVLNTGDSTADLTVRYFAEGGGVTTTRLHAVAAHSRKTITVGQVDELGAGHVVGAEISSDQPIVAERVMYFSYSGNHGQSTWTGGHVTIGATAPSKHWFFAEGNTQ